jgi:hypothetical protein
VKFPIPLKLFFSSFGVGVIAAVALGASAFALSPFFDAIPGAQCVEDRVRKAADNLPRISGGRIYGLDGTSNTPPAQALSDAGISFKFPACAWGSGVPLGNIPLRGLPYSLRGARQPF